MTAPAMRSHIRPSPVFLGVVAVMLAGGYLSWGAQIDSVSAHVGVFLLVVGGWVVTLCLHEFAHAYTAWRHGDDQVAARGYLTLNPLKYSHPVLSIGLPVLFIAMGGIGLPGGAVYLDTSRMRPGARLRISLAGPAANAVSAVVLLVVIRTFGSGVDHRAFWYGLSFLAFLQVMATILNLLPIPGLDGYGVVEPYLPMKTRRSLAQFAPFGLLAVFALLTVHTVNVVFFDAIYRVFALSGVPELFAQYGNVLMRFWLDS